MKQVIILFLLLSTALHAEVVPQMQVIAVSDKNNELVSGAKVELIGTGKVYYTNSKGECYIPLSILNQSKGVLVECISYKPFQFKTTDLQSKVVLEFR